MGLTDQPNWSKKKSCKILAELSNDRPKQLPSGEAHPATGDMAGAASGFLPKLSGAAEVMWMAVKPFAAAGLAVLVGDRMIAYKVSKAHHGHDDHGHGHDHAHVNVEHVSHVLASTSPAWRLCGRLRVAPCPAGSCSP